MRSSKNLEAGNAMKNPATSQLLNLNIWSFPVTTLPTSSEAKTDIATSEHDNPYIAYGEAASRTRIIGKLLKFNKFGDWVAGESADEMPIGTELVAHMGELMIGWIKWEDGKPTEQVMGRLADNFHPPLRSELGDLERDDWAPDGSGAPRDPWQFSNYLILMNPENGDLYTYASGSKGGKQAVGELSKQYGKAMRHRPDQFPVIALGAGEYPHPNKQFGNIKIPKLEIVAWMERGVIDEALNSMESGNGELEKPAEPPTKRQVPRDYRPSPSAAKLPKARF